VVAGLQNTITSLLGKRQAIHGNTIVDDLDNISAKLQAKFSQKGGISETEETSDYKSDGLEVDELDEDNVSHDCASAGNVEATTENSKDGYGQDSEDSIGVAEEEEEDELVSSSTESEPCLSPCPLRVPKDIN
jgi:hypothetical protein